MKLSESEIAFLQSRSRILTQIEDTVSEFFINDEADAADAVDILFLNYKVLQGLQQAAESQGELEELEGRLETDSLNSKFDRLHKTCGCGCNDAEEGDCE